MARWLSFFVLVMASGCATAKLAGKRSETPPDRGEARVVVIEPLFELAALKTTLRTDYATMSNGFGSPMSGFGGYGGYGGYYSPGFGGGPNTVAITREVREKPFFAKPDVLTEVHRRLLAEVQKRRPSWRVTSTSGAPVLSGPITIVRTVIDGNELIASDRQLKGLAFGFGLLIWPLEFINLDPVHETQRVFGLIERFPLQGQDLKARLVKYPSQPDYAVNLAGVKQLRREFGLDVEYTEGVLADEGPRSLVLIDGFVDRLASAAIALVEEP